ncbi:MAG TPA: hypothetical protein VGD46_13435 [Rhizobacter sp.]
MRKHVLCPSPQFPMRPTRKHIAAARLVPGQLVRCGDGLTALVMVESPHAGGWHGRHCMGGYHFVSDNSSYSGLELANDADWKVWVENRHWRDETPRAKPHLRRTETGRWHCYDHITSRVADTLQRAFDYHREAINA